MWWIAIVSSPSGPSTTTGRFLIGVGREDGDLGLVDDRQRHRGAEGTHVGDREGAADDLVGGQRALLRPRREIADLGRDQSEALAVDVAHDRSEESLEVEIDSDTEVDVVVHDERVAVDARVHVGEAAHDIGERPADEREVGEREALFGAETLTHRTTDALDALVVDLDRRVHVRARRLRPHHVLGGAAADVVEGHDRVAVGAGERFGRGRDPGRRRRGGRGRWSTRSRWRDGRGTARACGLEHVVARDATAVAGALDLRRIEARTPIPAGARAET